MNIFKNIFDGTYDKALENLKIDLKFKKIIVWGTGSSAKLISNIFEIIGINIECYIDNNEKRHGEKFKNIKINSPNYLTEFGREHTIIIASVFYKEISEQIERMGYKENENFFDGLNMIKYIPNYRHNTTFLKGFVEYQSKLKKSMDFDYHNQFIRNINEYFDMEDKTILEIGCGDGTVLKKILNEYKPKEIIGIDKGLKSWWSTESSKGMGWEIKEEDAAHLGFENNYFDAVISLATFEHISDLQKSLQEIKRVLKPGGILYAEFAPIWTSVVGHHYNVLGERSIVNLIPPWGHLWMNEKEMFQYLVTKVDEKDACKICKHIYHSKIINRLKRKDYYKLFIESGFNICEIKERICLSRFNHLGDTKSELNCEIHKKLYKSYSIEDLSVKGFSIYFKKPLIY